MSQTLRTLAIIITAVMILALAVSLTATGGQSYSRTHATRATAAITLGTGWD